MQLVRQRRGVQNDLVLVGLEFVAQILLEADSLGGDDVHKRAALRAGEDAGVDLLPKLLRAEDQRAARASEGLVCGGGDHMGIGHGAGMLPGGDKARNMRHVDHEIRADGIGDFAHALKVDQARISAGARDDELRFLLLCAPLYHIVVDHLGLRADAVEGGVEVLAGDGCFGAVGQMSAVAEIHAQDGVARLEKSEVDRHIGLGAGVRLDIGMLRAEEFLCPLDGEGFHLVHILAAAVIARAGVTLGVFIGQMAPHSLHNGGGDKVLRGDQLNMIPLTSQLTHHGAVEFRILCLHMFVIHGVSSRFFLFALYYTLSPGK